VDTVHSVKRHFDSDNVDWECRVANSFMSRGIGTLAVTTNQ